MSWENDKFARHNLIFYEILKFFLKYYSNILTVSKTSMLSIKKTCGRNKRIFYLYNSVNTNYISESNNIKNNGPFKIKIDSKIINLNNPNILYIATLTPRKCHLDLLEALSITNSFLNVNLVGYPTDKRILDLIKTKKTLSGNVIKSNINYFPKLSQKELCNLLFFSSAYISTSLYEGFGIPVLEAQTYKVPLIIRDIDINRELFPEAKFFNSTIQLSNYLKDIKRLSKVELEQRRKIVSKISEDNINVRFNYSHLSRELKKIIFN